MLHQDGSFLHLTTRGEYSLLRDIETIIPFHSCCLDSLAFSFLGSHEFFYSCFFISCMSFRQLKGNSFFTLFIAPYGLLDSVPLATISTKFLILCFWRCGYLKWHQYFWRPFIVGNNNSRRNQKLPFSQ